MSDPITTACVYCGSPAVMDDAWFCSRGECQRKDEAAALSGEPWPPVGVRLPTPYYESEPGMSRYTERFASEYMSRELDRYAEDFSEMLEVLTTVKRVLDNAPGSTQMTADAMRIKNLRTAIQDLIDHDCIPTLTALEVERG